MARPRKNPLDRNPARRPLGIQTLAQLALCRADPILSSMESPAPVRHLWQPIRMGPCRASRRRSPGTMRSRRRPAKPPTVGRVDPTLPPVHHKRLRPHAYRRRSPTPRPRTFWPYRSSSYRTLQATAPCPSPEPGLFPLPSTTMPSSPTLSMPARSVPGNSL